MWTVVFWRDALERALRTVAQTEAAIVVAAGTSLLDTDWLTGLSTAGMAGLLSLLFSFGGEVMAPTGTASWTTAVIPASTSSREPDDESALG